MEFSFCKYSVRRDHICIDILNYIFGACATIMDEREMRKCKMAKERREIKSTKSKVSRSSEAP